MRSCFGSGRSMGTRFMKCSYRCCKSRTVKGQHLHKFTKWSKKLEKTEKWLTLGWLRQTIAKICKEATELQLEEEEPLKLWAEAQEANTATIFHPSEQGRCKEAKDNPSLLVALPIATRYGSNKQVDPHWEGTWKSIPNSVEKATTITTHMREAWTKIVALWAQFLEDDNDRLFYDIYM